MSPSAEVAFPASILISDDFPHPLAPTSAHFDLGDIEKLMFLKMNLPSGRQYDILLTMILIVKCKNPVMCCENVIRPNPDI